MSDADLQKTPDIMLNRSVQMARLDAEIDFTELVAWLADGKGYKRFASEIAKCGVHTLFRWAKATPERRALIDEAQETAAESYVEMAENHLLGVDIHDKESAAAGVARAKALDNHYRWKASKHSKKYSDSLKLQGDKELPLNVNYQRIERVVIDPSNQ